MVTQAFPQSKSSTACYIKRGPVHSSHCHFLLMRAFIGNEMRCLEIIAVNARDSHMHGFLDRLVVARLSGEARLAALIILKRDQEAMFLAQSFQSQDVVRIKNFCDELCTRVVEEADALEMRYRTRIRTISAVA